MQASWNNSLIGLTHVKLCYFQVKLSLYQLPGSYLQFYSFLNIFTELERIAIQWTALSNLRTTDPRVFQFFFNKNHTSKVLEIQRQFKGCSKSLTELLVSFLYILFETMWTKPNATMIILFLSCLKLLKLV